MSGSCVCPWALLLLDCIVQPQCDGFCFIILYFYMFVRYLDAGSFLMRDRKGVDMERNWEEFREEKL